MARRSARPNAEFTGAALFAAVGDAFERIAAAAGRLRAGGVDNYDEFKIGLSFIVYWLS